MIQKFDKTPKEKRLEFISLGFSQEEVDTYVAAYTEKHKKSLINDKDILKTDEAMQVVNESLKKAGLINKPKDEFKIVAFRNLIIKPNKEGELVGRINPIDPYSPKKIGFHFKREEIQKFIDREIEMRKSSKEELFEENEKFKQRIDELEAQLSSKEEPGQDPLTDDERKKYEENYEIARNHWKEESAKSYELEQEQKKNEKLINDLKEEIQELREKYKQVKEDSHFFSRERSELSDRVRELEKDKNDLMVDEEKAVEYHLKKDEVESLIETIDGYTEEQKSNVKAAILKKVKKKTDYIPTFDRDNGKYKKVTENLGKTRGIFDSNEEVVQEAFKELIDKIDKQSE